MRNPAFAIGSLVVGSVVLVSLLAPVVSPYVATEQHIAERLQGPSLDHPLGTDQFGRDLLSRTLLGGRTALVLEGGAFREVAYAREKCASSRHPSPASGSRSASSP